MNGSRIHPPARTRVELLRGAVEGALNDCIAQHGPITSRWVGSAAKRIRGNVLQHVVERDDVLHQLCEERNLLRRRAAEVERALKELAGSPTAPTQQQLRHALSLVYGEQDWIAGHVAGWAAEERS